MGGGMTSKIFVLEYMLGRTRGGRGILCLGIVVLGKNFLEPLVLFFFSPFLRNPTWNLLLRG